MGMFDTVLVLCPECRKEAEFQSKSGDCCLEVFTLKDCPDDILANVNRHAPVTCECGTQFKVDIEKRQSVKVTLNDVKKISDIEDPKFYIGTSAGDKNENRYCLMRRFNGKDDVILEKTISDKDAFFSEVENLAKYFKAETKNFF